MPITPRRRLLAGVLTLTTVLSASACAGGEPERADSGTLSLMAPLFGTAPDPQGELHQAVEKFLGKKLDITWVPNAEYNDKVNVTLASDDIPQVMVIQDDKGPSFVKAAQAGAFWDLTDKIDKYPNLKPADERVRRNASVNGRIYGIYRTRPLLRSAVVYRKDWLDKLGLDLPRTVDDLYEVAKAFTEKDPDGNGKKDTYGLIIPKWPGFYASSSPYDVIETWFGAPNGWGERGGRLVPGFDTPEFLQANRFVKKMVDEGLVNPDFATFDPAKWNDPFVQGKGGIIVDVNVRAIQLLDLFREKDPGGYGDKVAMTGNLARSDGRKFSAPFTGYLGVLAISKQHVRTEQELDEVLKVLDKLASKEGQTLLTNGVEGRNFKVEDGHAVPINEDDPKVKVLNNDVNFAFIQLGTRATVGVAAVPVKPVSEPHRKNLELRAELVAEDLKTAVHNPTLAVISPAAVERGQTLNPIIPDARIKFLAGEIDEAGLKAEIKRWYDSGGTQIAAEINDLVSKVGS